MKKLVALLLAVVLMSTCLPLALAEDITPSDVFGEFDEIDRGHWNAPYDHSVWKKMFGFQLKQDAKMTVDVYLDGDLFNTLMDGKSLNAGYVTVDWPAVNQTGWHPEPNGLTTFDVVLTAEVNGQTVVQHYSYGISYAHSIKDHIQATWYPHNTVCVAGIEFRDVKPELTNKWYNFAAIDLSQDGTQTFDLVASNMYVVGTVTVTVAGDEVTVDWKLRKQGTTDANFESESEFLTFFNSLDVVTGVEPDGFVGPVYQFDQPISIANDLGGDTNVLLYIRNTATYCTNLSYKYQNPIYHEPYDPNQAFRKLQREAMFAIMDADTVLTAGTAQ